MNINHQLLNLYRLSVLQDVLPAKSTTPLSHRLHYLLSREDLMYMLEKNGVTENADLHVYSNTELFEMLGSLYDVVAMMMTYLEESILNDSKGTVVFEQG